MDALLDGGRRSGAASLRPLCRRGGRRRRPWLPACLPSPTPRARPRRAAIGSAHASPTHAKPPLGPRAAPGRRFGSALRPRRPEHRLGGDERARSSGTPGMWRRERPRSSSARQRGVWKSLDGGTTFKPVFDKKPVQSIGAIAIDPPLTQDVWVGTGESWTRNSVSIGDGIYKSTDGGETWTNVGLPESERITRIVVDPKNGDVVYACVPGKLWSDSADRGLYKTTDGGKTWSLVLKGANLSTGCSGLAMDPHEPRRALRRHCGTSAARAGRSAPAATAPDAPSGSGLYRTADGGKTWTQLTSATNKGLPAGTLGPRRGRRRAVATRSVVYALIESNDSALYRLRRRRRDLGAARQEPERWSGAPSTSRASIVDPTDPRSALQARRRAHRERGRRQELRRHAAAGSHGDWHDLWIDPDEPQARHRRRRRRALDLAGTAAAGGGSRTTCPISQFYHVSVDDEGPLPGLRRPAGQQLLGRATRPIRAASPTRAGRTCTAATASGRSSIPTDPEAVYAESQGGYIGRVDRRTHATRDIQPKAGLQGEAALQLEHADCA